MGKLAKNIGLVHKIDEGEYYDIQWIKPNEKSKGFVAKSADYTVIMHFSEEIQDRIRLYGGINRAGIEQLKMESQFRAFKKQNAAFKQDLENAKASATLGPMKKNRNLALELAYQNY